MKTIMNIKKAYKEIKEVCEKYADNSERYCGDIRDMLIKASGHLMIIDWEEKYGIKLSHEYSPSKALRLNINSHSSISYYEDAVKEKEGGSGRYISWSDDDKQPMNEWIFSLSFPTGAYIFGEDYDGQQNLFQEFFNELKTYNPDFTDIHNHSLFWKLENAKNIFDNFNIILHKYQELNGQQLKQRNIDKLKSQLKSLEEE